MDIKQLKALFCLYKFPVFYVLFHTADNEDKIKADAKRYINKLTIWSVFTLLLSNKNFASTFLYRSRQQKLYYLATILFRRNQNVEFVRGTEVGPGLKINHNIGCVIWAKSIGSNCSISQGVTIGEGGGTALSNRGRIPTIGDNVVIATNAIVIGGIEIGDNAIIGAGAVITKDVPANAIVVGNPQRIINCNSIQ